MQKEYICPRCFQKQQFANIGYVCTNTNQYVKCNNALERKVITFNKVIKNPVCDQCGAVLSTMICPQCGFEIPKDMKESKSGSVAIWGTKNVGKSNYIAVLINELYNKGSGTLIESIRMSDDATVRRFPTEFRDPLYKSKRCLQGTDAGETTPLIFYLSGKPRKRLFGVDNSGMTLTFFDTAGENTKDRAAMRAYNRYLIAAQHIFLLLDPLQILTVRAQLEGKLKLPEIQEAPMDTLNTVINMLIEENAETVLKNRKSVFNKNLAVIFTKIDTIESLLEPSSCLRNDSVHAEKGGFDVVDFEDENGEMKSLVDGWLGMGFSELAFSNFNDVAFFGVSALGSNPDMNNNIPRFKPFRVMDPLVWTLYKEGMINKL